MIVPVQAQQQADILVDDDGQASTGSDGCTGTGAAKVFASVEAAVDEANNTPGQDAIYICPGTYGVDGSGDVNETVDEDIAIKESVTITGAGPSQVEVNSKATNSGQSVAILLEEAGGGINTAEIRNFTLAHDGSGSASTINIKTGVEGTVVDNLTITRGSLSKFSSAIRFGDEDIVVKNCDISGGPIGSGGYDSGTYTVKDNSFRGAGNEALWLTDAGTLVMKNNTVETTGTTDPQGRTKEDHLGFAIYRVETRLVFENNSIDATRAPLIIGNDLPMKVNGNEFTLEDGADMRTVLNANTIKNTLDGTTNGKVTYVTKGDGTLRGEPDGKGPSGLIHVVRTGITNTITGGSGSKGKSALDIAQSGDIIHLTNGATYPEAVTLTSSNTDKPARADKNVDFAVPSPNSTPTTATLDTLTLEGDYTVKIPSGETPSGETPLGELVVGSGLTLGNGSTLDGNPIVLGSGATLTDNGLASGSIKATRTVGVGETVNFGNIGLTLTEDGGAPGETTVIRTDGDPVTKGDGSIERYYDVSAANSNLDVDLTFGYDQDELNGLTESDLRLFRSDDKGSSWLQIGTTSSDAQSNTLTKNSVQSFSRFTAAADGSKLPVEFAQVEAVAKEGTAILRWVTASETNSSGFRVQRKTESGFNTLQYVEGAGTTSQSTNYQVRLTDLEYGTHTFRLEQVDHDGSTSLSDPVTVELGIEGRYDVSDVRPNPAVHQAKVEVAVKKSQTVSVTLFDALGRRVKTLHRGRLDGETTHHLSFEAQGLANGAYFLRLQGEQFQTSRRVMVIR
jgi:hypothetical protein